MEAMKDRPRCYVASPLGFSEAGRHWYREVYLPALRQFVEPVDPWALISDAEVAEAASNGEEQRMARTIGERNREALQSCELLVAFLDGQEVDAGTAAEVGFGAAYGLKCFGLRSDYRQSGEPGATINLQVEAFIAMSGGRIVRSLEELLDELRKAAGRTPDPAVSA
jgi:nucleoside 2-deoxyribosyltransferase